jgi:site-specific DNA-methyltransferase (adenine-specific)
MINKGLFSGNTSEWSTPDSLFKDLDAHFGPFTLDPCATPENAKCPHFFTKEDDGLKQNWSGRVFMNPPYGRQIGKWIEKAYQESLRGVMVVCLLPAKTDPQWFHRWCVKGSVRFIEGRVRFSGSKINAPFPSMIVVFWPERTKSKAIRCPMT